MNFSCVQKKTGSCDPVSLRTKRLLTLLQPEEPAARSGRCLIAVADHTRHVGPSVRMAGQVAAFLEDAAGAGPANVDLVARAARDRQLRLGRRRRGATAIKQRDRKSTR